MIEKKNKLVYNINPKASNAQLKQTAQLVNNLSTGEYTGAYRVHRTDVEEKAQVNFGETSLKIESRDEDLNKVERTITNINNAKSNAELKEFAMKIIDLTNETYIGAERIDKLDVTAEDVEKPSPTLNVGTFTQDGTTYTAAVTYYGDGTLKTNNGTLDGSTTAENNILNKFTGTLTVSDADGSFAGTINASEGINYGAIEKRFSKGVRLTAGSSAFVTTGDGDDYVSVRYDSNVNTGDGNDTVSAIRSRVTVGAGDDSVAMGGTNGYVAAGAGDDTITTYVINDANQGHTLHGGDGNDYISARTYNYITGGNGNDTIRTSADENNGAGSNTIYGGSGNDSIVVYGNRNRINAESGDNFIKLQLTKSQNDADGGLNYITAADGNNTVTVRGYNSSHSIQLGDGNNSVAVSDVVVSTNVRGTTITTGNGNNYINTPKIAHKEITTGSGNDTIYAGGVTGNINSGAGDDVITISSNNRISNSYVHNIRAGEGNDTLSLYGADYKKIIYNVGDGDDVINGFANSNHTLSIVGATYEQDTVGNDLVLTVGEGHITLVGAASGLGTSAIHNYIPQ